MFGDLAQQLMSDISRFVEAGRANADSAFSQDQLKTLVERTLSRSGLVTREEFDAQSAVLARTREKLETLEANVESLEQLARQTK